MQSRSHSQLPLQHWQSPALWIEHEGLRAEIHIYQGTGSIALPREELSGSLPSKTLYPSNLSLFTIRHSKTECSVWSQSSSSNYVHSASPIDHAEIWFFFSLPVPSSLQVDKPDSMARLQLQRRLGCRTFHWFLTHVYPELFPSEHRPWFSGKARQDLMKMRVPKGTAW